MREPVGEFTIANEIAEHIIRVDLTHEQDRLFLVTDIQEAVLVRLEGSWSTT